MPNLSMVEIRKAFFEPLVNEFCSRVEHEINQGRWPRTLDIDYTLLHQQFMRAMENSTIPLD